MIQPALQLKYERGEADKLLNTTISIVYNINRLCAELKRENEWNYSSPAHGI